MSHDRRGRALHRSRWSSRWRWRTGLSATTCTGWSPAPEHLRVERGVYRLVGVNPDAEQTWGVYARSVLAFSAVSILFLYAFLRLQDQLLPLSLGFARRHRPRRLEHRGQSS